MKRRDMKYIVSALQASKPMLEINVSDLDKDGFLLNTPDGTYYLPDGLEGRRDHSSEDYITKITAAEPGDKGEGLWQDSLNTIFCGDAELIDYVQQIVGMAAVDRVYMESLVIAYGEGRNGKSTFWNTIARVLGTYSGNMSSDTLTVGCKRNVKPELAEAKGKRLIIAAELEEGMRLNTAVVKQMCSTDEIFAEKKYKDPFSFTPSHTLVLYTNHLPRVGANDPGTWRRLIVIPFHARIEGAGDVKNYADYLVSEAAPAVMAWIIEGAKKVISCNFHIPCPACVEDAIKSYREDNDWLGHFLSECCETDKTYREKSGVLYQEYRSYCARTGEYTKKRSEFNRMIEECMAGGIDMIITKSISRFARNTLDCLKYIRELKEKNIPVFFEKENINTMDSKGEVLLTIMASLAQQESQSLSQNIKLGLQYRYQNGEVQVNHNRFLGYTKDEEGHLIIDPAGAEVVKRIYREYLEGGSLLQIARGLEADGILTAAGKSKWRPETLRKILQNEKYIGDALLQKPIPWISLIKSGCRITASFHSIMWKTAMNPSFPVNFICRCRRKWQGGQTCLHSGAKRKKRVYSSKYALSSIVYCPKCGEIYRRIAWNNRGKHSVVWRCCTRVEHGPDQCDAPTIQESDLQAAVVKAINLTLGNRSAMMTVLQKNIETVILQEDENSAEGITAKLKEKQQELLKLANAKKDYNSVADEIDRLRELKQKALTESAEREGLKKRIDEMREFLNSQTTEVSEYDEQLVRRLIEKVTVYEERFEVEFKSGMTVDVER